MSGPSAIYAAWAEHLPREAMLVFGTGVYLELLEERGSPEAVGTWAARLAKRLDRVILLNIASGNGASHTLAIAPPSWSTERVRGYVAGRHEELESAFGSIEKVA